MEKSPSLSTSLVEEHGQPAQVAILEQADLSDVGNPRNWRPWKKRLVFMALMSSSILTDGGMAWGASLVVPQAIEWNIAVAKSATSLNYGTLLLGFGGVLVVPLIDAYGRMPIWLWSQVLAMAMVIGCCFAPTWSSFTALRALQGLFGTVPQVLGLSIIHDMYVPRDWAQMINIWGTTFIIGPFLGPAIAGYLLQGTTWRGAFGVLAGMYGFSTLLVIAFGRETFYNADTKWQQTSPVKAWFGIGNVDLPKRQTLQKSTQQVVEYAFKFPLLFVGIATMINFTWPIGVNTTVEIFIHAPPYSFNNVQAASLRFSGIVGDLVGFIIGYFFNEWIYNAHNRKQHWRSEYRLHGVWLPLFSMICGLLTFGLTLQFGKSWLGLAFGWVMINTGMVGSTVAITAFALEKYPNHSSVVAAIINMWRTCGGFAVPYFQSAWVARNGAGVVFGIQAATVAFGAMVFITPVILRGKRQVQHVIL